MKHELGEGSFERGEKRMEPKFLKLKVSTPPVSEKRSLLYLSFPSKLYLCLEVCVHEHLIGVQGLFSLMIN